MHNVVDALRVGWYGNGNMFPIGHPKRKVEVDCRKLWSTCLTHANTIYVPICDGISGKIGTLLINKNHTDDPYALPIDTLVLGLTKVHGVEEEIGHVEMV